MLWRKTPKSNQYGCGKFHKTFFDKPAVLDHVPCRYGRYGLPLEIFETELKDPSGFGKPEGSGDQAL